MKISPILLILLFSISCSNIDTNQSTLDQIEESAEISAVRGVTSSNPPSQCHEPPFQWTDPNCQICQLHDANGLSVYFYCGECIIYYEVDQDLRLEIYDNSNGFEFLVTNATVSNTPPSGYYDYTFDQGNPTANDPSGFDGYLKFVTSPLSGLG